MNESELLEMVKKGASRYMRMYPAEARDLFQAAALAATKANDRGQMGGQMMLAIKGACVDYLHLMHNRDVQMVGFVDILERPSVKEWDLILRRLVEDLIDPRKKAKTQAQWRAVLILTAAGFTREEIAGKLGKSVIRIDKILAEVREYQKVGMR